MADHNQKNTTVSEMTTLLDAHQKAGEFVQDDKDLHELYKKQSYELASFLTTLEESKDSAIFSQNRENIAGALKDIQQIVDTPADPKALNYGEETEEQKKKIAENLKKIDSILDFMAIDEKTQEQIDTAKLIRLLESLTSEKMQTHFDRVENTDHAFNLGERFALGEQVNNLMQYLKDSSVEMSHNQIKTLTSAVFNIIEGINTQDGAKVKSSSVQFTSLVNFIEESNEQKKLAQISKNASSGSSNSSMASRLINSLESSADVEKPIHIEIKTNKTLSSTNQPLSSKKSSATALEEVSKDADPLLTDVIEDEKRIQKLREEGPKKNQESQGQQEKEIADFKQPQEQLDQIDRLNKEAEALREKSDQMMTESNELYHEVLAETKEDLLEKKAIKAKKKEQAAENKEIEKNAAAKYFKGSVHDVIVEHEAYLAELRQPNSQFQQEIEITQNAIASIKSTIGVNSSKTPYTLDMLNNVEKNLAARQLVVNDWVTKMEQLGDTIELLNNNLSSMTSVHPETQDALNQVIETHLDLYKQLVKTQFDIEELQNNIQEAKNHAFSSTKQLEVQHSVNTAGQITSVLNVVSSGDGGKERNIQSSVNGITYKENPNNLSVTLPPESKKLPTPDAKFTAAQQVAMDMLFHTVHKQGINGGISVSCNSEKELLFALYVLRAMKVPADKVEAELETKNGVKILLKTKDVAEVYDQISKTSNMEKNQASGSSKHRELYENIVTSLDNRIVVQQEDGKEVSTSHALDLRKKGAELKAQDSSRPNKALYGNTFAEHHGFNQSTNKLSQQINELDDAASIIPTLPKP